MKEDDDNLTKDKSLENTEISLANKWKHIIQQNFQILQLRESINRAKHIFQLDNENRCCYQYLFAVIGADGSASAGINSEPRPSFIMLEARSIIAAVSGRVALYSRSLTGA